MGRGTWSDSKVRCSTGCIRRQHKRQSQKQLTKVHVACWFLLNAVSSSVFFDMRALNVNPQPTQLVLNLSDNFGRNRLVCALWSEPDRVVSLRRESRVRIPRGCSLHLQFLNRECGSHLRVAQGRGTCGRGCSYTCVVHSV